MGQEVGKSLSYKVNRASSSKCKSEEIPPAHIETINPTKSLPLSLALAHQGPLMLRRLDAPEEGIAEM